MPRVWTSQEIAEQLVGILLRGIQARAVEYVDVFKAADVAGTIAVDAGWYEEVDWDRVREIFATFYGV